VRRIDYLLVLTFIWLSGQSAMSQILDDSTKLVYGPHTSSYVLEEDMLNSSGKKFSADTSISDFHNYGKIYRGHQAYQDLGNLGTPAAPIFYEAPTQIGKTLGYNGFNLYAYDPQRAKYFDTKSPYSSLSYIQGTRGQQILEGEFYRNVHSRWSLGFSMKTLSSKKIIGAVSSSSSTDNRLASMFSFIFSTRYFTKDERYQVLGNFTFFDSKNKESGGIRPDNFSRPDSGLFDYTQGNANLYSARTLEKRFNFHIYQELGITKSKVLQLFHVADYRIIEHRFTDVMQGGAINDTLYYPPYNGINQKGIRQPLPMYFDPAGTNDKILYNLFENRIGIKGRAGNVSYRAYLRTKNFTYRDSFQVASMQEFKKSFSENFIGGGLRYAMGDSSFINITGEYFYLGRDTSKTYVGTDYFLKGDYSGKNLFGGIYAINSSPTLLQRQYTGNNFRWDNNFKPTNSKNVYAGARLDLKNLFLQVSGEYSLINNYIYYNELAKPAQDTSLIDIFSLKTLLKFSLSNFHLEEHFRYTNLGGYEYIKMPTFYSQTRIYYKNILFKRALLMQIGFDFFWKSAFQANYYMPVTQQFYLNNNFIVQPYLLGDFFIDARIKRANIFVKVSHFNQLPLKGYFITPYYSGMPRTVELGITWMFFD
jgi:Putative porin